MSRLDRALERRRQETGTLPDDIAGAADWLQSPDGKESIAPAGLLDHFSNEDSAPVRRSAESEGGPPADFGEPVAEPMPSADPFVEAPFTAREEPLESVAVFSGFNHNAAGKVVSGPKMDHGTAEQYGRLAAALHHAQAERGIKKVMVTSAMAGEGKTLTALNLALTLSESYRRRVVFIDADLRCSRVHELLNVVNVTGLSDVLKDAREMKARLLPISPRLSVLLAGRSAPDPMGALTSQPMAQILDEAAANFDWVIVDTPPVVLLPDTNLLARMVDGAIVVIQAGRTAYDVVERAVQAVDRKRVLGVVLNDVQDAEALQYYYSRRPAVGAPISS
jgi:protein-tyrosine kinase